MLYKLKDYQRDAVDKIKQHFDSYYRLGNKTITFKAPTGSGKTFMMSSVIEEVSNEMQEENFCFVWASIGKGELQKQSFDSVSTYLGGYPVCSLLENEFFGSRSFIKNKEVVFANWEKLIMKDQATGTWKNNLMKSSEGKSFLDVLDQTRDNGTKIILIVDESHIGGRAENRIAEFKSEIIKPFLTIEMSATPQNDPDVEVDPVDVVAEGMIKEDIIVNEGIKEEMPDSEDDSEIIILKKAEEKRQELIQAYKDAGSNVNPLVLVQIPNVEAGEAKKLVVKDFVRGLGITEENGKLKLWCDNKGNFDKKAIKKNDDDTCYLIFKTAVATGWDCPRAHILVKFREGHSETFEIQTVGRILRTAEAKSYEEPLLDNAYIYTNIKEFETSQDSYNPNRIKTMYSYIREPYTKGDIADAIELESFYRSREGDYNSADSRFGVYLEKVFMEYFGLVESDKYTKGLTSIPKFANKGLNLDIDTEDSIITETQIETKSIDESKKVLAPNVDVKMSDSDVQAAYYELIKSNLSGLAYVRSKSPINMALVDLFDKFYGQFDRTNKISNTQRIVVQNSPMFAEIVLKATADFREMLQKDAGLKGVHYRFAIEDKKGFSKDTHRSLLSIKSLYQPLYVLMTNPATMDVNKLEKDFISYLDRSKNVTWFWENGPELMKVNFGISYNSGMNTFQPDFIVMFANGSVGIFDTKASGQRVEDTKAKAEALFKYIASTNRRRGTMPQVVGGIVMQKGSEFYVYNEAVYHDISEGMTNWKNFNDLLVQVDLDLTKRQYDLKRMKESWAGSELKVAEDVVEYNVKKD